MSRRAWLHICAVAGVCLLALLMVSLHRARGAEGHVSQGRALADAWCATCHGVPPYSDSVRRDLDFEAIARMPSTTELSLRVFLRSNHNKMPNIILKPEDLDDIVAFILSMKRE
jgi:cytochrome c